MVSDGGSGGDRSDPVVRALRAVTPDSLPTAADRQRAEEALILAIAQETPPRIGTATARKRWGLVGAAAALLLIVVIGVQLARPTPASAALSEIAYAASLVDPLVVPAQSFAYTRSVQTSLGVKPLVAHGEADESAELIASLLPVVREAWMGSGGFVQLREQFGRPVFFTPEDEAAYYALGLDQADFVGETITRTLSGVTSTLDSQDWPTEPDELLELIRSLFPPDRGLPEAVEVLDIALDLLRESGPSPELRAAVIRILLDLDLELAERSESGDATFAVTYEDWVSVRDTFTLDSKGNLIAETTTMLEPDPELSIPAGTVIQQAIYEPTIIVDGLDQP
jgi:hypothetical protein